MVTCQTDTSGKGDAGLGLFCHCWGFFRVRHRGRELLVSSKARFFSLGRRQQLSDLLLHLTTGKKKGFMDVGVKGKSWDGELDGRFRPDTTLWNLGPIVGIAAFSFLYGR